MLGFSFRFSYKNLSFYMLASMIESKHYRYSNHSIIERRRNIKSESRVLKVAIFIVTYYKIDQGGSGNGTNPDIFSVYKKGYILITK